MSPRDADSERDSTLAILRIDPRFNGPPESGNGGYVCGEIAKVLDTRHPGALASGVRVRLRQPPALDKALRIAATDDGCGLFDEDVLIAQAWAEPLELDVPEAISLEAAREAARSFRGHTDHIFPGCFVCGPERAEGDGLRIFPGALSTSTSPTSRSPAFGTLPPEAIFASPWQPDPTLAGPSGDVDASFVWAALDCPGCFSFPQPEGAIVLLGEMTAALTAPVKLDEASVLLSWQIEETPRKHRTGSAIYDAEGRCCGYANALWIELPQN